MTEVAMPHLRRTACSQQLIVDGKAFLILGGELQNSSASSSEYMGEVWENLKATNLNTILASVSWEQIEPEEGVFDFTELDNLITTARKHGFRLVLLWFGSFKNGLSTYTPPWVKCNAKRFPRARLRSNAPGTKYMTADVLSIFGTEAQMADARAFRTLMHHIKRIDERHSTVIMTQVENEVGLLGDSRDRSDLAEKAYNAPISSDFVELLRSSRAQMNDSLRSTLKDLEDAILQNHITWADLPCTEADRDELFMAYHYALFVEQVAVAGKAAYPIPLYTNVWQNYGDEDRDKNTPLIAAGGSAPGDYPSGGGVAKVLDVWQTFAPSLDFIAPDIYLNDYAASCLKYRHRSQALFIPEQRRDEYGALRIWSAFGSYQCIGTAPFGVDTVVHTQSPFTTQYALLSKVSDLVLDAQAKNGSSVGFFFDEISADGTDPCQPVDKDFGNWNLSITRSFVFGRPSVGYGMVVQIDKDRFLLVGRGFQVSFTSNDPRAYFSGILRMEEKDIDEQGDMRTVRLLNGDETRSGRAAVMPSESPDYGGFPISITIPSRTGIAVCEPYALFDQE